MMTAVETYLLRLRRTGKTLSAHPGVRKAAGLAAWSGSGFLLGAAALGGSFQPLAAGLVCALSGWRAVAAALGSVLGYRVFWGQAGLQGAVWAVLSCVAALIGGRERLREESPLLMPALAGCLIAGTGLAYQMLLGDETSVPVYLIRVAVGAVSAWLFAAAARKRDSPLRWAADGLGILALAQIAPVSWLGLGFLVAGWLAAGGELIAAVLAGMALDLAGVTPVPMTVVLAGAGLLRRLFPRNVWLRYGAPGAAYVLVMGICGVWAPLPVPGLLLGGAAATRISPVPAGTENKGRTGMAQVRLEIMAGVMDQSRQALLQLPRLPIDQDALARRVQERACGSCPSRKHCRDVCLPGELLSRDLTDPGDLGIGCKKPGRMVAELRRGQEQLRILRSDRERRQEYREAVMQQYAFLGDYLREQSDILGHRGSGPQPRFRVELGLGSAGREVSNGDVCQQFSGPECRHYVLLCDGMGSGLGAAAEAQRAGELLRQMLTAGFPAEHALRSLNSLLALGDRAGAVTVDLAEIRLDTGRVTLYKWGAAPSWLLRRGGTEKIGTAGPPPGLTVTDARETVDRLSLRRGEALILFSDGVDAIRALGREGISPESAPGELAAELLERAGEQGDDATVAVIRLVPAALAT